MKKLKLFEFQKSNMNTFTQNINQLKSYFANEINECKKLVEKQKDQITHPVYLLFKRAGFELKIKNIEEQELASSENERVNFLLSEIVNFFGYNSE